MPTSDSDPVTDTLEFQGVWLHDPASPESTARHFLYGPTSREHSIDPGGSSANYAGRTYAVTEYGEHEEESASVTIAVPYSNTYDADLTALDWFARARRTLWFRDGRGRSFAATLTGFKIQDQKYGAQASFTAVRADYPVEEVAA